MAIRINGYDINTFDKDNTETVTIFTGVAHVEDGNRVEDIPFEGRHELDHTGFVQFSLKDPDEIDDEPIRQKADLIRDILAQHLLAHGFDPGEYFDVIPVKEEALT